MLFMKNVDGNCIDDICECMNEIGMLLDEQDAIFYELCFCKVNLSRPSPWQLL